MPTGARLSRDEQVTIHLDDRKTGSIKRIGIELLPHHNDAEVRGFQNTLLHSFTRLDQVATLEIEIVFCLDLVALRADELKKRFDVSIHCLETLSVA